MKIGENIKGGENPEINKTSTNSPEIDENIVEPVQNSTLEIVEKKEKPSAKEFLESIKKNNPEMIKILEKKVQDFNEATNENISLEEYIENGIEPIYYSKNLENNKSKYGDNELRTIAINEKGEEIIYNMMGKIPKNYLGDIKFLGYGIWFKTKKNS